MLQAYFPVTTRLLSSAFAVTTPGPAQIVHAMDTTCAHLESDLLESLAIDIFADPQVARVVVRNGPSGPPTCATRAFHVVAAVDRGGMTQLVCLRADGHRLGRFTLLHGAGIHLVMSCSLNRWSFAMMERVNAQAIALDRMITGLSDQAHLLR